MPNYSNKLNKMMNSIFIARNGNDRNAGDFGAPVATLGRALEVYRQQKADADATISFRGGEYYFEDTVVLGKAEEPVTGRTLTITAWESEKVLLSGGRKISSWQRTELQHGKIWSAHLPWTAGGQKRFHALYRGRKLLTRAASHPTLAEGYETTRGPQRRFPTDLCTTYVARTELHFPEGAIKAWDNLDDLEIRISPQRPWLINYLELKSVDVEQNIATVKTQATYELLGRFVLENHVEFISGPGQWALDTKRETLYYWPEDEIPGDDIIAPVLPELIRIEGINDLAGEGDDPVRGIHLANLTLSHCDRAVIGPDDKGLQHDWALWDKNHALIRLRGAVDCSVTHCCLQNTGGDGVRLDLYCQNNKIAHNVISETGGMGVLLAGYGPGFKDVNKNNTVLDNDIFLTGTLWAHAMGVYIWQSGGNRVAHNHIHELGYMGIVVSGVRRRFWDPIVRPRDIREYHSLINFAATAHLEGGLGEWSRYEPYMHARNNVIEYNEIHDCMRCLADGNTIYLSATGAGNIVRCNLGYNHKKNFLMRCDDDQFYSLWEKNILIGSRDNPRGFTHKGQNAFDNNILINCVLGIYDGADWGPSEGIDSIRRNIIVFTTPVSEKLIEGGDKLAPGKVDCNLFYSADPEAVERYLAGRQAKGIDTGSKVADPTFADLGALDFTPAENSAVLAMGIEPVDFGKIGLLLDPAITRINRSGGLAITGAVTLENVHVG
jgi:hypothetical protein